MQIIEPVFANIRSNLNLNKFSLRGKTKVDIQWKIYTIKEKYFDTVRDSRNQDILSTWKQKKRINKQQMDTKKGLLKTKIANIIQEAEVLKNFALKPGSNSENRLFLQAR